MNDCVIEISVYRPLVWGRGMLQCILDTLFTLKVQFYVDLPLRFMPILWTNWNALASVKMGSDLGRRHC